MPEETAIALTYDGATQAVMMATPLDLEDFAVGFSLTERIVASTDDIGSLDVVPLEEGVELRMWLEKADAARRLRHGGGISPVRPAAGSAASTACRRRCARPRRSATSCASTRRILPTALDSLPAAQSLNRETRAVHAAGFWRRADGLVRVREDVGRHNALDKLVGAMRAQGAKRRGWHRCF